MSCRIDTTIGGSCSDLKLHTVHPLAGRENVSCRPLAICLLEPIFQAYFRVTADQTLDLIEINDDVIALADPEAKTRDLHGRGQEVSIVRNHPERYDGAGRQRIGEKQLVESRRTAIQDAETIAPFANAHKRLDHPVGENDVTEQSFEIEGVEAKLSGA